MTDKQKLTIILAALLRLGLLAFVSCSPSERDCTNVDAVLRESEMGQQLGPFSDDQAEYSMELAIEYLQKNSKSRLPSPFKSAFTKALESLTALNEVKELDEAEANGNQAKKERICGLRLWKILKANEGCAKYAKCQAINQVIDHYRDLFFQKCQPVFIAKFKKATRVGTISAKKVTQVMNGLVLVKRNYLESWKCINGSDLQQPDATARQIALAFLYVNSPSENREHQELLKIGSRKHSKLVYNAIFPDVRSNFYDRVRFKPKSTLTKAALEGLFDKYVLGACDYFVKRLGPAVFALVDETKSIAPRNGHDLEADDYMYDAQAALRNRYYNYWTHYKMCKALLEYKSSQMAEDLFELKIFTRG